jgi:hypothetical protein
MKIQTIQIDPPSLPSPEAKSKGIFEPAELISQVVRRYPLTSPPVPFLLPHDLGSRTLHVLGV